MLALGHRIRSASGYRYICTYTEVLHNIVCMRGRACAPCERCNCGTQKVQWDAEVQKECREGKQERLLAASEHADWVARIDALRPQLQGPVYFLWGTDWEDAPVVNAKQLQAALPDACRCFHALLPAASDSDSVAAICICDHR